MSHIVGLGHGGDAPAEGAAARVEIGFAEHEAADLAAQRGRRGDGDRAAHAVAVEIDRTRAQAFGERGDRPGMTGDRIIKIVRAIAEARAEEIGERHGPAGERRVGRNARIVAGRGAAESMDKDQRHAFAGKSVIAQLGVDARQSE